MEEKKQTQKKVTAVQPSLVKVKNSTFNFLVQPSTGIRIDGKSEVEMKEDGWLRNQIAAKLLSKV